MAKAKKYLAVLLSSVITLSLIVIPGIMGTSAATSNDFLTDSINGEEGYASFLVKDPNPVSFETEFKGASLTTQNTTNNYVFLKQLDLKVTDPSAFNQAGNFFWFSGVDWQQKWDDLTQLSNNGYVELWVKANKAVDFEIRINSNYGYYSHTVNFTETGSWKLIKLNFVDFKSVEYATSSILKKLRGIKVVINKNSLETNDEISFGSMRFYTDNTDDNGYVKVNEGELKFNYVNVGTAAKINYSDAGEKFNYSKKLTFTASDTNNQKTFDIEFSTVTLGANDYLSFWARSATPITTAYSQLDSSWGWNYDEPQPLKTFGGGDVWKEYRVYGSELKIGNVQRIRCKLLTGNLKSSEQYSIEFSGFAVYSKIDPQNNIYASEKELSEVKTSGGATDNIYLANKEVTDSNGTAKTAYQVAVTNSAFYTSNSDGASFVYYGCDQSWYTNYNISKLTKDGYIKTYIKTEKPIKLLFSVWGSNWTSSTEFPVYISGSSEWQEILIPLSRLGATDVGFPRVDSGETAYGTDTIEYNHVYAFRWRVAQNQTNDFLPVVTDGVYDDSNSVYFAPLEFVRMIHADLDNNRNLDSKDFDLMRQALLGIKAVTDADADANADGNFDIVDLVHLKKLLNEMAPNLVSYVDSVSISK